MSNTEVKQQCGDTVITGFCDTGKLIAPKCVSILTFYRFMQICSKKYKLATSFYPPPVPANPLA